MAAVIIIAIICFLFIMGYRFMEKFDGFLSTSACVQEEEILDRKNRRFSFHMTLKQASFFSYGSEAKWAAENKNCFPQPISHPFSAYGMGDSAEFSVPAD